MNLEFVCKYKSIDSIEVPQLPNFTILTGLNGSGKTHLLEAIKSGNIKVSDFQKDEIVLYNYATFNIKDQNLIYDQTITQNIKNTRVKISQLKQNNDQYKTLYNKLSNPTPNTLKELNINDESLTNSIVKELKANNINFLDLNEDEQNNLIKRIQT
ncbi:OLD family protein [Francisella philomiragia]|uniref:hypothetical protein n=1 Tax=Francisella philomiragia TaxID=28110 RepID=UPI001903F278|nr:hypothetical protein [Francisella philomiragia]MBK2267707.1 hypothetical protein [Francisella philomiragia]MBK2279194.1 hypothetical protein [Francisella philomiragia]MBK2287017.1 hypothetical protein [Francisella philomiragia]MBK2289026.1 hypothetical protein [Francisella philomiragia]MBK2290744.1 hypothetical protein [Francisella philomiragia]